MPQTRVYRYVGPVELRELSPGDDAIAVTGPGPLADWLGRRGRDELAEPFTFAVTVDGILRLAPRHSEHVALAGGDGVLAAGEMTFALPEKEWRVVEVSNQSTGFCPDPDSWVAVAAALGRAGVPHPGDFTATVVFRRCPECGERNVVRDGDFTCALCDGVLPGEWNFDHR